jgi:chloramphenicol 3-O-phosphotransferase
MGLGNIILINGTSSAGKSTIAKALQDILEPQFYLTGIDHFLRSFHERLIVISSEENAPSPETWLAIFENEKFKRLEIGPRGYQVLKGMYRSIASLSESGIHSIVDDVPRKMSFLSGYNVRSRWLNNVKLIAATAHVVEHGFLASVFMNMPNTILNLIQLHATLRNLLNKSSLDSRIAPCQLFFNN